MNLILVLAAILNVYADTSNGTISGNSTITTSSNATISNSTVTAPNPCSGSIIIAGQTDLNNFSSYHCSTFDGNITIIGVSDMSNLTLQTITGTLKLQANTFSAITGLSQLQYIGKELIIDNNAQLLNLFGFDNLRIINYGLTVTNNRNLITINGMLSLQSILGNSEYSLGVILVNNVDLRSIAGLSKITSIGNTIYLSGMPLVSNLLGFPQAVMRVRNITIDNMYGIGTVDPLSNLLSDLSGTTVSITNTKLLQNVDGLSGLSSIVNLNIYKNAALSSIAAFSSSNVKGSIHIDDNGALCDFNGLDKLTGANITNTCGIPTVLNQGTVFQPAASTSVRSTISIFIGFLILLVLMK
ncbi:hypothetical protein HK103_002130 [Boothiomyces macroporosus]|uniref:Uncharacterized protein n=1 Tax=Boothiomyces macroporosus TaxID=261099 RepID=A0AAD5UJF4_9FUNG|nr:hypothetical protein HK103_002130 [Boothiomyces macroporosus]